MPQPGPVLLTCMLVAAAAACAQSERAEDLARPTATADATDPGASGRAAPHLLWNAADGTTLLDLKPGPKGYKVFDGSGALVAKLRVKDDRVKIKGPDDTEQAKLKLKSEGAELEDAAGRRLYRIKPDAGGHWKLRDADGQTLAKFKLKADGFEVRDSAGETLAKVKSREERLAFETEAGERLSVLKGTSDARAGMWLALERLPLAQRAALLVFFLEVYR